MAKKSKIAREKKVVRIIEQYRVKRKKLVDVIKNAKSTYEERLQAQYDLAKLPRNSSQTRHRNRCAETGRPRGYYRKFGLCRNILRQYLMNGLIPGGKKASW